MCPGACYRFFHHTRRTVFLFRNMSEITLEMERLAKQPKRSIKNWVFPTEIIRLWESEMLNAEQIFLLGFLHILDGDEHCFASNQYLAAWWRKKPRHVQRTLEIFKKMGLIKIKLFTKNQRVVLRRIRVYLHAAESYDIPERQSRPIQPGSHVLKDVENVFVPKTERKNTFAPMAQGEIFLNKYSNKLLKFLQSKKLCTNSTTLHKTKRYLGYLLNRDLDGSLKERKARLKSAILCYTTETHNRHTPEITGAYDFREKFKKVENWMRRENLIAQAPTIEVENVGRIYR